MESTSHTIAAMFSELWPLELSLARGTAAEGLQARCETLANGMRAALHRYSVLISGQRTFKDAETSFVAWKDMAFAFWSSIGLAPDGSSIDPSVLQSSTSFRVLDAVFARLRGAPITVNAQHLMTHALGALWGGSKSLLTAEREAKLITLLTWWGDEVCGKRWGLKDVWAGSLINTSGALMSAATKFGTPTLIEFLATGKGVPVDGNFFDPSDEAPLYAAFQAGNEPNFDKLLQLGADVTTCYSDGYPLAVKLFRHSRSRSIGEASAGAGGILNASLPVTAAESPAVYSMLRTLLRERPQALEASCHSVGEEVLGVTCAAICSKDVGRVKVAFEAGARLRYHDERVDSPDGSECSLKPTLYTTILTPSYDVMEYLITEQHIAEDWTAKHDRQTQEDVAAGVAVIAVSSYPRNPEYTGPTDGLPSYDPSQPKLLKLALSAGLVAPSAWLEGSINPLLGVMYPNGEACMVGEDHTLALLKQYREAGLDVAHYHKPDAEDGAWGTNLAHLAARTGQRAVLKFAIDECGCPVDGFSSPGDETEAPATPLILALCCGKMQTAIALLLQHYAASSYVGLPAYLQPISLVLVPADRYDDKTALGLIKALCHRDASCLSEACFAKPGRDEAGSWNPLRLAGRNKPECRTFLASKMAGAMIIASAAAATSASKST